MGVLAYMSLEQRENWMIWTAAILAAELNLMKLRALGVVDQPIPKAVPKSLDGCARAEYTGLSVTRLAGCEFFAVRQIRDDATLFGASFFFWPGESAEKESAQNGGKFENGAGMMARQKIKHAATELTLEC